MTWLVFALGIVLGWCVRAFPSRSPAELLEPVRRRRTLRAWNAGRRGIALMPARAEDALEAAGAFRACAACMGAMPPDGRCRWCARLDAFPKRAEP